MVQTGAGTVKLLVAQGETVPGPILEIGNTHSRYRFARGAKDFINPWFSAGCARHCAVGGGPVAGHIEKLGALLKIEVEEV